MLEKLLEIDYSILHLINSEWTAAWADRFFPMITDLHKTSYFRMVVIPLVFGLYIWRQGLKKAFVIFFFCLASIGLADGIGNHGYKKRYERLRPGDTQGLEVQVRSPYGGYSFVSNHSSNMFAFACFNALLFPPSAIPLFILATIIGYSRIYNGVHFPSDVLMGATLGIVCGYLMGRLCIWLMNRMDRKSKASSI